MTQELLPSMTDNPCDVRASGDTGFVASACGCELTVIIPTYREAENLPVLIPRIGAVLELAGLRGEILVIDDDSNDGTADVCEQLAASYPVRLLVRTAERGLSSAVIHGMLQARGEILVVMDADLSHPPEVIPTLFKAVASGGSDFAIGSRYIDGGDVDVGWGHFRRLNSSIATMLAWPLSVARDPLAGFFALRRTTFEAAVPRLNPIGYKIGLELLIKCNCRNVKEVPISFRNRLHGLSKMTFREQINYLRHLGLLYSYRLGVLAQPTQFALIGATGVVIDLCAFSLLVMFLPAGVARALAIWFTMTWTFALNRKFTFAASRASPIVQQYTLFCGSCLGGAAISWFVFIRLYEGVLAFTDRPLSAATLGILCGAGFNFLMSKYVAFR